MAVIALILMLRPVGQSPELLSNHVLVNNPNVKKIHSTKITSTNTFENAIASTSPKIASEKTINHDTFKSTTFTIESMDKSVLGHNNDTIYTERISSVSNEREDTIIPDIPLVKPDTISHRMNIASLKPKELRKSDFDRITKSKYRNQWLLAAAFGSGSSASSGLDNVPLATLSDNIVKTDVTYNSIMSPQSFSDVHYSLPLSVGLKIRNKFSEILSIETGLIYTYLQTDFSNSGFTTTDARLGLHYLGIPLSLNMKVWNNPKWEVYISGGGTIEKGLRSIYQQTQNNTYQTWVTTAQTNIDGLQFSANSALGVGYKIMPKIGIFFEPQFSYYFQNNQPISIRSHQPAVFSMQVGLRYNLNETRK